MQALKTEAHKIQVAAEETAEQELRAARKARKAEQKKSSKKPRTKHGFVPERSAEEATYDHAVLHKHIVYNSVSATRNQKFDIVFVDLASDAGVRTWTPKKVERVLEYIDPAETGTCSTFTVAFTNAMNN
jgi:hypothetical protein